MRSTKGWAFASRKKYDERNKTENENKNKSTSGTKFQTPRIRNRTTNRRRIVRDRLPGNLERERESGIEETKTKRRRRGRASRD